MFYQTLSGVALVLCAALPQTAYAQRGDTLTLDAVYDQLRMNNPRLAATAALVNAERARETSQGILPDPQLQLGTMSVQAMQMVPFPGKLSLSSSIAKQQTAMARSDAEDTWWQLRAQAAMSYNEVYLADGQLVVMRQTIELLQRFQKVAQAMYSAGQGRQADVLRASVEIARMQADTVRMTSMRAAAIAKLNALLNRDAQHGIDAQLIPASPARLPSTDTLVEWAGLSRPMVAKARIALEQSITRVALARREVWPDLTIGLQYGQQPGEMGSQRAVAAMIGFTIPVFAKQRQLRMRDEALAMQQMAIADLTQMRAITNGRVVELVADLTRSLTLLQLYDRDIVPQAKATVESAFSSYRVGAVDFETLANAQLTANTYRQEIVALRAQYGSALAELEMTIGRELPRSAPLARR
jgi:outer membrane protein, heavy metal efflux system